MNKKSILDNRIFHMAMNVLSSVILVFSIVVCAMVIISTKSSTGVANLGGYSFLAVQSDSMEDEFFAGDLIMIRRYSKTHQYDEGDIISFLAFDNTGSMYINTHRVVEVIYSEGVHSYVTKGDNADKPDKKHVTSSKILGQYTGKRVSNLGKFFDFAETSQGVLLLIVLPAALIVIWQLFGYLRSLAIDKKSQPQPVYQNAQPRSYPPAAQSDKDAIIREYLRQQQEEEARKQQIIEEYLQKQKELEQAEKEKAEEAKIKAIIAEFLAQQKAAEEDNKQQGSDNNDQV